MYVLRRATVQRVRRFLGALTMIELLQNAPHQLMAKIEAILAYAAC